MARDGCRARPASYTGEPRRGEYQENGATLGRTAQAGEQGEGQHREDVLRRPEEVQESVVERTQAARHEVSEHDRDPQRQAVQESAFQRKNTPPSATSTPAPRKATRPHGHRRTNPSAMPVA